MKNLPANKIKDLKEFSREERREIFRALGEPAYREKQLHRWILSGAESLSDMTDIPLGLRETLACRYAFCSLTIERQQVDPKDGTRKFLLKLPDNNTVEAVFMKYNYGNTLCVSTQVGCAMGCRFCASGIGGRVRNLAPWEMLYQYTVCRTAAGEPIGHVVLMGMGEPFDNYDAVSAFLRMLHEPDGIGMSYRNMTVSTCGVVPGILQFAQDFSQSNLAVSLHATSQEERLALMPVARKWPLQELLNACRDYVDATGRRITFEYALITGENDSDERALKLADLLKGMLCHVNIIPLNPVRDTGLTGSTRNRVTRFASILEAKGIPATVRRQLGSDIDAACGQLRRKFV